MKDRNGKTLQVHSKISVDKVKQPVFEITEFRGANALVKCVDDHGDGFFKSDDTLWIPETALLRYEIVES